MKTTITILGLVVLLGGPAYAQITQEDAIDLLEQYPAAKLDSLLPKTAFLSWFRSVVGSEAKITWEINDCGEQTGVAAVDQQRDLPVCFEISALLPDRRIVGVAIAVGTERKGLTGSPAVYNIYLDTGKGTLHIKRLRDLPQALRPPQNR
ncbi:MAG: hypothetical protein NTU47_09350 [Ignavibacteriales bacterium]|nr:hypothetical protein [Ignavibacteriales bacterium]